LQNKNFVLDFVLLSRILYYANIGKINHTASYTVYLLFFFSIIAVFAVIMQCRSGSSGRLPATENFFILTLSECRFSAPALLFARKTQKTGLSVNVLIYRHLCRLKRKDACVKKHYSAT
jgi:hypothetical protein